VPFLPLSVPNQVELKFRFARRFNAIVREEGSGVVPNRSLRLAGRIFNYDAALRASSLKNVSFGIPRFPV
jgi:hypothetical protein